MVKAAAAASGDVMVPVTGGVAVERLAGLPSAPTVDGGAEVVALAAALASEPVESPDEVDDVPSPLASSDEADNDADVDCDWSCEVAAKESESPKPFAPVLYPDFASPTAEPGVALPADRALTAAPDFDCVAAVPVAAVPAPFWEPAAWLKGMLASPNQNAAASADRLSVTDVSAPAVSPAAGVAAVEAGAADAVAAVEAGAADASGVDVAASVTADPGRGAAVAADGASVAEAAANWVVDAGESTPAPFNRRGTPKPSAGDAGCGDGLTVMVGDADAAAAVLELEDWLRDRIVPGAEGIDRAEAIVATGSISPSASSSVAPALVLLVDGATGLRVSAILALPAVAALVDDERVPDAARLRARSFVLTAVDGASAIGSGLSSSAERACCTMSRKLESVVARFCVRGAVSVSV